MTFKITAWNSDGTDIVEIDGPVSPDRIMEAETESCEIWCPHCFKKMTVGHLNWDALTCRNCKSEVDKPDWLMPLGS